MLPEITRKGEAARAVAQTLRARATSAEAALELSINGINVKFLDQATAQDALYHASMGKRKVAALEKVDADL